MTSNITEDTPPTSATKFSLSPYQGVLPYKGDRDKLQLLSRYELTLERSLYKALHELQRLQAERQGMAVSRYVV